MKKLTPAELDQMVLDALGEGEGGGNQNVLQKLIATARAKFAPKTPETEEVPTE